MSVEEAKDYLFARMVLAVDRDAIEAATDRLILEAKAEMPCYEVCRCPPESPCGCGRPDRPCGSCPSCTARMKLKETADEVAH